MRRLFVLVSMLVLASSAAMADGLNLNWREARVVKLAKPATSIVIGDPTVADVTLDSPTTMIVFGKTPGQTNILVLDRDQELLLDWPLMVTPVTGAHVSVVNAAGGETAPLEVLYACGAERCARVLSPTDVQFAASSSSSTDASTDASNPSGSSTTTNNAPSGTASGQEGAAPASE